MARSGMGSCEPASGEGTAAAPCSPSHAASRGVIQREEAASSDAPRTRAVPDLVFPLEDPDEPPDPPPFHRLADPDKIFQDVFRAREVADAIPRKLAWRPVRASIFFCRVKIFEIRIFERNSNFEEA